MYTWIPIHQEAIAKLLELHESGSEPIATLRAMDAAGLKVVDLDDTVDGRTVPLEDIDPFTFFANFNRGITDDRRRENWAFVKERWGLDSAVPEDFAGIPTLHNMASRLFPRAADRQPDHIPLLWKLAEQASRGGVGDLDPVLFDHCLALRKISTSNLTIGLFWINPEHFLSADHKSTRLGETRNIAPPTETYAEYRRWLEAMTTAFGTNYPAISHQAHLLATGQVGADDGVPAEEMERLWERFHKRIKGFTDFENPGEAFVEHETGYKHALLQKFTRGVGREKLQEMIGRGAGIEASKVIQRALNSNIASFRAWDPTLGTTDATCAAALAPYLLATEKPYAGPQSTAAIFETAAQLGLKPAWDAVSLLLWALRPDDYFPVKISHFRALAQEIGRPLPQGPVNAERLDELIGFGRLFEEALADKKPADWVDVQSFLWVVCPNSYATEETDPRPRWWCLAAGEGGEFFDEFVEDGVAAIGARGAGDLRAFESKDDLRKEIQRLSHNDHSNMNEVLACWQFVHEMRPGDIVIAKTGQRALLGKGEVVGDYEFDPERANYKHVRKVRWLSRGKWEMPEDLKMPTKTLTDISGFPDHIRAIETLISGAGVPPTGGNYWWLNANPKDWDFDKMTIGDRQTYTSHNERGNKRRQYRCFQEAKPGDLIVGYVTSPQREVIAICRITKGLHQGELGEEIEFEKLEHLRHPIPYATLEAIPGLAESEPMRNNQGSLFRLTEEEFDIIRALIDESVVDPDVLPQPYTKEDAMRGLFLAPERFDSILFDLREKKNVILQGAPGVGKTFIAKRLAFALMGQKDASRLTTIQFHQSYSYEDFIQGFRPTPKGNFELRYGIFHEFCHRAQRDPDPTRPWVFIIDEINRGNLSKIFGELMMLLEADKRGREHEMPLAYARSSDELFHIPENVYVLGMMNTADRSLAMVDYALRRRFRFVSLEPEFESAAFRRQLEEAGAPDRLVSKIVSRMTDLNKVIGDDLKNLGPGFRLGHSFFCPRPGITPDDGWYRRVIESEIVPMLEEYWFDQPKKVADARSTLLA